MSFRLELSDGAARLLLDRPPTNAFDLPTVEGLAQAFGDLGARLGVTGLIIEATGRGFSSGVDTAAYNTYGVAERRRLALSTSRMLLNLYGLPFPVVAAIGGHALGTGLVLALCADVRLGADDPRICLGLNEAWAGMAFPRGALEVVRAELSPELLRRLALTSDTVDIDSLRRLGVIDEIASPWDLPVKARARVRALAAQPAFKAVKAQIRGPALARISATLATGEDDVAMDARVPKVARS
jgi:enoyl-CoA hydratase